MKLYEQISDFKLIIAKHSNGLKSYAIVMLDIDIPTVLKALQTEMQRQIKNLRAVDIEYHEYIVNIDQYFQIMMHETHPDDPDISRRLDDFIHDHYLPLIGIQEKKPIQLNRNYAGNNSIQESPLVEFVCSNDLGK